ncbi:MAG: pantoate--beta-alanine ligase [Nitrospirae bacterium]|nr:pantoate--beta-alanine ligase [Nitrospirota bacterium]
MQRIKTIKDMRALSRGLMSEKKSIGFVPTMGALHEGHLSLVRRSKEENDITVVSIFVNPIQFGLKEDFNKYPRDIDGDLKKLSSLNVDFVFIPEIRKMYPDGFSININIGGIGDIFCGAVRLGHFNGVATVVAKLFNIVMPHRVYFGQKDFQQTVIIKKLVRELNFDIDIIVCPTVREADGLAMSSRNSYLSPTERKSASILYRALKHGEGLILQGKQDASYVKTEIEKILNSEPLISIEYIGIVKPQRLESVEIIDSPVVICLAVRIGTTRLIDNLPVSP